MGLSYEDLEELCETVGHKIKEANDKVRMSNGDLSGGDVEFLDKLTHMLKSIKTTMAMMDAEEGYSGDNNGMSGRYYPSRMYSRATRRDSRGRYSRTRYGYSGDDEMIKKLHELMEDAPDDKTRQEFQKFISRIESM